MKILHGLLLLGCLSSIAVALPTPEAEVTGKSYASDASQLVAINLLKSNIDIDGNQVHSPLGVTTILAVLAEGAAGETYDEFEKIFGHSKDRSALRSSFKRILGKYQNRDYGSEPSFQTWFYVYRNNSAREEFKQLIKDFYFVEVKDISHRDYDWSEPNTSLDLETSSASNSKDVIGFETLKRIKTDDEFQGEKPSHGDSYGEETINKEASKFDRFVDDKQYVEKPVILEEIKRKEEQDKKPLIGVEKHQEKPEKSETEKDGQPEKLAAVEMPVKDHSKREEVVNEEENETVKEDEKVLKVQREPEVVPIQEVLASNEPEKVSIPLEKLESAIHSVSKETGEIMMALESHISNVRRLFGARSLFNRDDISSALSANSITGRDFSSKTKMLLFNGLYFRGNWAHPFFEERKEDEQFFYMTAEDAMRTPMMRASGKFHVANVEHLNAKILCLPYQNKRYALMLIVPNDIEGLHSVIDKLQPDDFKYAKAHAEEKELRVILPKFQVEETSRSETMLKNLGLRRLFSRDESNFSLLSDDRDLHVDEVVQFVNVRVDEGGSNANSLSASNPEGRNGAAQDLESIEVNRPFLYFVMDCEEDFVIASGKIYSPEFKDEQPISIEVALEEYDEMEKRKEEEQKNKDDQKPAQKVDQKE